MLVFPDEYAFYGFIIALRSIHFKWNDALGDLNNCLMISAWLIIK